MRSTIQDYLAELKGKRVAVIGIGVSNTPLIKMLLRAGIRVTACDKRQKQEFGGQAEALESLGAELRLGPDYLEGLDHDVIFRTPGLRPDVPQLLAAVERGSVLTSEMEVFFQVCPCNIIAVTGSDGKTTTTTMSTIMNMTKTAPADAMTMSIIITIMQMKCLQAGEKRRLTNSRRKRSRMY